MTEHQRRAIAGAGLIALAALGLLAWHPLRHSQRLPSPTELRAWEDALQQARRIDINAAGGAELERLPEVGPALAARILDYRQRHGRFATVEELRHVAGIGPKTLEALRDYITTE